MNNNINKSIESYNNPDYNKYRTYERFSFLKKEMTKSLNNAQSLLDIGCAKGELIYLLKEDYPNIQYTGLEYAKELLQLASKEEFLNNVEFIEGDAQKFDLNRKFDIVVMSGVLSIFDDIKNILSNMTSHIKKGGSGYIFGAFTKEEIDIIIRYKNKFVKSDTWESGWNIFSIQTIKDLLIDTATNFSYKKFDLKIDLHKQQNPVTTHTIDLKDDGKLIVAGDSIIRNFYLLSFTKK